MIVQCMEKGGSRVRVESLLSKNQPELERVVEKMSAVPNFLDDRGWKVLADLDFTAFKIDDVGIVGMDMLVLGEQGRVHVTFWDGKMRGRELLCRRIAMYWIEKYKLKLVFTSIPVSSPVVIAFCKRVGFTALPEEGGLIHLTFCMDSYLHGANSNKGGV